MTAPSSGFTHIDNVLKCTSIQGVWALHIAKMKEFGFDSLLYGSTRFRTDDLFGDLQDSLILTNRSADFFDAYVTSGLFKHAPTASWASSGAGTYSWRDIWDRFNNGELSEKERMAQEINIKFGILYGYSISFSGVDVRSKCLIGLCARNGLSQDNVDALWQKNGHEIVTFNNVMHLKLSNLPHTGQRRSLTTRQRQVLEMIADGKTTREIAVLLDLKPVTVEKHLKLAREVFGVETTAQAVQKAALLNLLFLPKDQTS